MLHHNNRSFGFNQLVSLLALLAIITVSLLAFNVGLSGAHYAVPDAEKKQPPPIEEEFNAPDPCAEANAAWAFVKNAEPQAGEKDCGDVDTNPANQVESMDPCGTYVFARQEETHDLDQICELENLQI